jgi:rubredoxin
MKRNQYSDIPIAISEEEYEGPEIPELICPRCQFITKQKDGVDYEYQCNHCDYIFNVKQEDVRTKSNVIMPEGRNTDVNVSYLPEPDNRILNQPNLKVRLKS